MSSLNVDDEFTNDDGSTWWRVVDATKVVDRLVRLDVECVAGPGLDIGGGGPVRTDLDQAVRTRARGS